jgi:hypothetical protein
VGFHQNPAIWETIAGTGWRYLHLGGEEVGQLESREE